ncbi:sensor histidine kinase [Nonomuraea solani]|uniref:sensor histidine kinase n=1 Tax=Nonomuraea solani TaxID=1144553 RepID=UPI001F1F0CE9|nr:histidine kinase [Nonomuraea solani]
MRWLWNAGLGAGLAVVTVSAAARIAETWGGSYWRFDCAAGTVGCAIVLVRHRHRLWAAVAGMVVAAAAILVARLAELPAEPGPGLALSLAVLVGSAVRVLPVRQAVAVAAGGLAVVGGSLAAALTSVSSHATVAMLNGACWLAALAAGLGPRLLAARRRTVAERVRRHERLALARELHDVVAHHVTCVVLQAQAARLVAGKHPEKVPGSLADIESAGSDALAATRRVVGLLREPGGTAPTGEFELDELVGHFNGPPVRLRLPSGGRPLPPEVAGTVYRVVQESLTNISRHAPNATSVTVTVARDRHALTVEIADKTPGPRPHRGEKGGYGLVGMRERAEAFGGTLTAGPRPGGGGWTVLATLPLPERGR